MQIQTKMFFVVLTLKLIEKQYFEDNCNCERLINVLLFPSFLFSLLYIFSLILIHIFYRQVLKSNYISVGALS